MFHFYWIKYISLRPFLRASYEVVEVKVMCSLPKKYEIIEKNLTLFTAIHNLFRTTIAIMQLFHFHTVRCLHN